MFIVLLATGALLALVGGVLFLYDACRIHWLWAVGSLLVPFVNIVCLVKHWAATKRGFIIGLFALPFLVGAFVNAPKVGSKFSLSAVAGKPGESGRDPFWNAMQRARDAVGKTQVSRQDAVLSANPNAATTNAVAPIAQPSQTHPFSPLGQSTATPLTAAPVASSKAPKPTPKPTLNQRLASNRAAFKELETQFAAMNVKRKALPKNDTKAIASFNLDAKVYADKLAATRSEQAILLELTPH